MEFIPYSYQNFCISKIVARPAVGLFLACGLGKTVITLTALQDMLSIYGTVAKPLIIAPKRVAVTTWTTEREKWEHLKNLSISLISGTPVQRIKALQTKTDIYVMGRDNVKWLVDYLGKDWDFDTVVIDESSSFKNSQSQRFKALKKVRGKIKRLVELTGTPASNGLEDLWAQMYLLDMGQRLGRTLSAYRQQYFVPGRRNRNIIYEYIPKEGSLEAIKDKISDICISLTVDDCLQAGVNLPDMIVKDIPVLLSKGTKQTYNKLEKKMLLEVDGGTITAQNAAVLTGKLLQLCNGAMYVESPDREFIEIHDDKISALLELLEQLEGENVLVFYNYAHDMERLLAALKDSSRIVKMLDGADTIEEWNAGKIDVLLAQPASCGYGLNLQQGGRYIIWFGLPWSLEEYEQANARLHRQGQKDTVIVYRLAVQGGMDESVLKALDNKDKTQTALIEALRAKLEGHKHV